MNFWVSDQCSRHVTRTTSSIDRREVVPMLRELLMALFTHKRISIHSSSLKDCSSYLKSFSKLTFVNACPSAQKSSTIDSMLRELKKICTTIIEIVFNWSALLHLLCLVFIHETNARREEFISALHWNSHVSPSAWRVARELSFELNSAPLRTGETFLPPPMLSNFLFS